MHMFINYVKLHTTYMYIRQMAVPMATTIKSSVFDRLNDSEREQGRGNKNFTFHQI